MVRKKRQSVQAVPVDPKDLHVGESKRWDHHVEQQTGWCHYLQSQEWAAVKQQGDWRAFRPAETNNVAWPFIRYARTVPLLGAVHYIPKFASLPQGNIQKFTEEIRSQRLNGNCVVLELDQRYSDVTHRAFLQAGWKRAAHIQYELTVQIDLRPPEQEILRDFKKRARWEIGAANRRGVIVRQVPVTPENCKRFYTMLQATAGRANFRVRSQEFSEAYWELFSKHDKGFLYEAVHEEDVLAMAFIIKTGNRAFYKDSGSVREKANLFASRLLQWRVIQDMKQLGCTSYDLCGVFQRPGTGVEDGLVTFKTAFAPIVEQQGAYVLPLRPVRYWLWSKIEPLYTKLYLRTKNDLWY